MIKKSTILIFLFFIGLVNGHLSALIIDSGSDEYNNRFNTTGDSNFIGKAYDWSGVGWTAGSRWVTMVSDSYFLSANHWHPSSGDTVTFWEGNYGSTSHTYTVGGGQRVGSTDLWLGQLTTTLDSAHSINPFPVLMHETVNEYVYQEIFVYGAQQGNNVTGEHWVGKNVVDAIGDLASAGFIQQFFANQDPDGTYPWLNSTIAYEAKGEGGDSGAPSFHVYDGQLALTGIHWATSNDPSSTFDTFVSEYYSSINSLMSGESLSAVGTAVIPEPASLLLLVLASFTILHRRRRIKV